MEINTDSIFCKILLPKKTFYSTEQAQQVILPGFEGELAVLAGHIELVTRLKFGLIKIQLPEGDKVLFVNSGIAHIVSNPVTTIIVNTFNVFDMDNLNLDEINKKLSILTVSDNKQAFSVEYDLNFYQNLLKYI